MSERPQGWRVLLSHHASTERHHCYRLPVTRDGIHLCARCMGLYPVLLATIGFEAVLWRFESEHRWLLAFGLVTPAVIHWSASMLFSASRSNRIRTITGIGAGVGLGLAFGDYFRDSSCVYFWGLMGSLAAIIALVWWTRAGRASPP
jgi:uncharacterized membrane protein